MKIVMFLLVLLLVPTLSTHAENIPAHSQDRWALEAGESIGGLILDMGHKYTETYHSVTTGYGYPSITFDNFTNAGPIDTWSEIPIPDMSVYDRIRE